MGWVTPAIRDINMGLHTQEERGGRLLYILADGHLREQVEEGTLGAKLRVVLNDDGSEKARKHELIYPGITGTITSVGQYIGDYGTNINVHMKDENGEEYMLSLKAASFFGESFMHKLPNIDLTKEVSLSGYDSFIDKDGKKVKPGLTVMQDGVKLKSFFSYYDGKEFKNIDGFPLPDKKTKERGGELWTMYYDVARVWMLDYLETNGFIQPPKTVAETSEEKADEDF